MLTAFVDIYTKRLYAIVDFILALYGVLTFDLSGLKSTLSSMSSIVIPKHY